MDYTKSEIDDILLSSKCNWRILGTNPLSILNASFNFYNPSFVISLFDKLSCYNLQFEFLRVFANIPKCFESILLFDKFKNLIL